MQKALNATGHLMPVGFYYKWFTKPSVLNDVFMKAIRPMTGVGRLPQPAPESDLLAEPEARDLGRRGTVVIGAGLAGLAAAAAADGDVLLVDDQDVLGGQRRAPLARIAGRGPLAAGRPAGAARLACASRRPLQGRGPTRERGVSDGLGGRGLAAGHAPAPRCDGAGDVAGRPHRLGRGRLDAFPMFDDGDRPGIMGPARLYRLVADQGMDVKGLKAVVYGHGSDAALSALLLHVAGAEVVLAIDAEATPDGGLLECAQRLGWSPLTDLEVHRARSRDAL